MAGELGAVAGLGAGAQGIFQMGEKARGRKKARKRAREEMLQTQRTSRDLANSQHKDRVQMGQANSGLEGGLANERMGQMEAMQGRDQFDLGQVAKHQSEDYGDMVRAGNVDVVSDILGIITGASSGASALQSANSGKAPQMSDYDDLQMKLSLLGLGAPPEARNSYRAELMRRGMPYETR